jgi:hypothetical protein
VTRVFRFFDGFLVFLILALVGVAGYFVVNAHSYLDTGTRVALLVGAPVLVAVMLAGAFKMNPDARAALSMMLFFGLAALYVLELALYLGAFRDDPWADVPGDYDRRGPLKVVADLRAHNVDAYPVAGPKTWMESPTVVGGHRVMPLSEVSDATVVLCNESGSYVTYESDRYGFNNPDEVWGRPRLDVALVGDSFVEGWCVEPARAFAELIRDRHEHTVNLGRSGNGPLSELGSVREYLVGTKPREVFWFLYEGNDLTEDLRVELSSSILREYLDDAGFRQRLQSVAAELNDGMRSVLDDLIITAERKRKEPQQLGERLWTAARSIVELQNLRDRLGLNIAVDDAAQPSREVPADVTRLLRAVLARASEEVSGWGGTLHLVYLPKLETFSRGEGPRHHDAIVRITEDLGIPLLDGYKWFASHPDPMSLFPFDGEGPLVETVGYHYDAGGHRLIAEGVLDSLE